MNSADAIEEVRASERSPMSTGAPSSAAASRTSFTSAEEDSTTSPVVDDSAVTAPAFDAATTAADPSSPAAADSAAPAAANSRPRAIGWKGPTTVSVRGYTAATMGNTDADDEEDSSSPVDLVAAEPPQPLDPLQTAVQSLVGNILEGLRGFDGSITWLKRTHSATAAKLDAIKASAAPEATEEFSVAWFGIASAVLHDLIEDSVEDMNVVASPPTPLDVSTGEAAASGICATPRELSVAFVSGLQSIVADVMNDGGCHGTGGSHHFSRYSIRSFAHAKEVSELSSRLMQEHLEKGSHLPPSLRDKYSEDTLPLEDKADVCAVLKRIADAWVCSFFPTYQQRARGAGEVIPYLWGEEANASRLNLDLFFYCFYFACQQRSLVQNADGYPRGVVVPTAWMERLLCWSTEAQRLRRQPSSEPHPPFPGPIDTFALMTVAPHDPRRHWLVADPTTYQVIPESLYDSLFDFFGSGPKYVMYGAFPLRSACLDMWKPMPLTVFVTFEWSERNAADGALDKYSVEVPVEEALLHSDMREVCHLAWGVMREEKEMMSDRAASVWFAAINGTDTVRLHCKGLYMLNVQPAPFAIADEGDGMDLTVREVVEQLRGRVATDMPDSAEEWTSQTSRKVWLSLVLTLHNTNGDDRGNEVTGAMEVAAHQSGVCGLTNVGNTCYMNSALQCLSNLTSFRTKLMTLPISHFSRAVIAPAFIRLLTSMWSGQHSFAETRELKEQIGARVKRFAGYQQQDANEFVEVLLDHLSEEINLVSARCYRQREDTDKAIPTQELSTIFWDNFLENNDSFIPPLFFHQSKTVFTCLTCGESSTVFDNNVTLSVSIKDPPQRRTMGVDVVVELHRSASPSGDEAAGGFIAPCARAVTGDDARAQALVMIKVHVLVQPDGTVRKTDVEEALAQQLRSNACASNEVVRFFQGGDSDEAAPAGSAVAEAEAAQQIADRLRVEVRVMDIPDHGRVFAWARCHLDPPATASAAPVARVWYFMRDASLMATAALMGSPLWMDEVAAAVPEAPAPATATASVNEDGDGAAAGLQEGAAGVCSSHVRARCRELAAVYLQRISADEADLGEEVVGESSSKATEAAEAPASAGPDSLCEGCTISWNRLRKEEDAAGDDEAANDAAPGSVAEPATIVVCIQFDASVYERVPGGRRTDVYGLRGAGSSYPPEPKCTLQECLRYSMQPDVLRGEDAWFCGRCKEFRETRVHRTLYRLPPCLIVSFKRFKMHTYSADKKNTLVQFPGELDFEPYLDPEAAGLQEEGTRYRLRGVVYHSGSLSFGHYTATAFNDSTKKWVHYNDAHATIDNGDGPAPNGAYILCFERIEIKPEVQPEVPGPEAEAAAAAIAAAIAKSAGADAGEI